MNKPIVKCISAVSDYIQFQVAFDESSESIKIGTRVVIDGMWDYVGVRTLTDISYYKTFVRFLQI
jgi:hypothetical protein